MTYGTLNERLRSARKNANLKLKDVAKKLGTHTTTINKYEMGIRNPDVETLLRLCDIYEVPMEYLLAGKIPPGIPVGQLMITPSLDVEEVDVSAAISEWERARKSASEKIETYLQEMPIEALLNIRKLEPNDLALLAKATNDMNLFGLVIDILEIGYFDIDKIKGIIERYS